jgi:HlyD family secretion protein
MRARAYFLPLLAGLWTCAGAREVTVEVQRFAVELEVEALVVPGEPLAVTIAPATGVGWTLEEMAGHGSQVKKGETFLRLDTREIDSELGKQRLDAKLRELALAKAVDELAALEESVPVDLAAAQRKAERAREDLEYFTKVGREAARAQAAQTVVKYEHRVESIREELTQLEAMYKADDLTEETEEIILKRQRDDVAEALFDLEQVKLKTAQAIDSELPRQEQDLKEARLRSDFELAQATENLPRALEMKRQELVKARAANAEADRALADLEADRKAMEFVAPADAVIYYGEFANGSWNGAEAAKLLVRGAKLPAHRVLATLVPASSKPRLVVRLTESQLGGITAKTKGSAALAAQPGSFFPVSVRTLAAYPDGDGRFLLELDAQLPDDLQALPGMSAKVRLTAYQADKALLVPKDAITRDAAGAPHVALRLANGTIERRVVRTGHEHNGNVEILTGVEAGQVVVVGSEEKPS